MGLRDGLTLVDLANAFGRPQRLTLKTVLECISAQHPNVLQMREMLVPDTQHWDTQVRWCAAAVGK
jgi:hypothetical protein